MTQQMPIPIRFSSAPEIFDNAERLFNRVSSELMSVLSEAEIHHVGSTAIRGTLTKGDLDILVRAKPEAFEACDRVLSETYARNPGSDRTDEFSAFCDDTTDPPLGLQLVVSGSQYDSFLQWRNLIRDDVEIRDEYDDLKRRFDGCPEAEYREAKGDFIEKHLGAI